MGEAFIPAGIMIVMFSAASGIHYGMDLVMGHQRWRGHPRRTNQVRISFVYLIAPEALPELRVAGRHSISPPTLSLFLSFTLPGSSFVLGDSIFSFHFCFI